MPTSRISAAVHRLTRVFLGDPGSRLTPAEVQTLIGLEEGETRIVIEALKDAGFLLETPDGFVVCRSIPAA